MNDSDTEHHDCYECKGDREMDLKNQYVNEVLKDMGVKEGILNQLRMSTWKEMPSSVSLEDQWKTYTHKFVKNDKPVCDNWFYATKEPSIEHILLERSATHGNFNEVAETTQKIKELIRENALVDFSAVQQEALDMIASKLARILCGDPNFIDHWQDFAGYATLVVNDLKRTQGASSLPLEPEGSQEDDQPAGVEIAGHQL